MNSIKKATSEDAYLLSEIGRVSLIESHGHSAPQQDIDEYVNKTYTEEKLSAELADPKNIYHIISHNEKPAGFSKMTYNSPHKDIPMKNITKLDRIYLLKEFYGLKLGAELLKFLIHLSKQNDQGAMWLYTWKENDRAISFYKKAGFRIIGSADFRLTARHSNPNWLMFLEY